MNKFIGKTLARLRRERGLSQKDVAQLLAAKGVEITNQAVSKWEKGISQPNAGQFLLLCRILDVEDISGEFMGCGIATELNSAGREKLADYARLLRLSGLYSNKPRPAARLLPLYDLAVSAGTGQFLSDSSHHMAEVPEDVPDGAKFGVRVAGDSMEPRYQDGQTVWVHPCETLENGEIGVFVYDGNAYLKRLVLDGSRALLRSLNEKYADIPIVLEDFRILGKAY
ncbi:MAG: S24 family peptidase [Candidatus Heteroscillospira sp.]